MKLVVPTTSFPSFPGDFAGHFILSLLEAECAGCPSLSPVVVTAETGLQGQAPDLPTQATLKRFRYLPGSMTPTLVQGGIMPNLRANPLRLWQVPFLLRAFRRATLHAAHHADLVHAHWSISGFCALSAARQKLPVIVTLLGSDFSGAGGRLVDALTRYVVRRADGVICVNDRLRERVMEAGVERHRVVTLRNGIDIDRFQPRRDRAVLAQMGIQPEGEVILFLGRLADVKGPDRALDVFERFLEHHPQATLLVVGDGPLRMALTQRVQNSPILAGHVHWAGSQPTHKIPGFLAATDALLISSRNEGLPTTVLEALAAGLPIVTVPAGGIPEIIKDGEMGFCAATNAVEPLADALKRCFSYPDLRASVAQTGRDFVVRELSWAHVAHSHLDFYNDVIARRAPC